jgi:prepilin peptidase CpaA
MNDPISIFQLQIVTLSLLLAGAVICDYRSHRIPNLICVALLVSGLSLQVVSQGMQGFLVGLGGVAVALLILLPFYAVRGMGAGDVKMLAASGSFLGPMAALVAGGLTLLGGAILALGLLAYRAGVAVATSRTLDAAAVSVRLVRKERFPYALAVAVAAVVGLIYGEALVAALTGVRT